MVGAGLIGSVIAYHLANNGRRVAIADAQKAGQGATGRAVALATPHLIKAHHPDTTRGVEALTTLAIRQGVTARTCRSLHLMTQQADLDTLHELCESFVSGRPRLVWETRPDSIPKGYGGGVVAHNSALIDLVGMATRLTQHPNITLYPNTEALGLERDSDGLSAKVKGFSIPAQMIVLAPNAYAGMLSPYLAEVTRVVRGVTWTSLPLDADPDFMERVMPSISMPMVIDHGRMLVAQTLDSRLRITAWQNDALDSGGAMGDIKQFLSQHIPLLQNMTHEWRTGATTFAPGDMPLVDRLPGDDHIIFALGAGMYGPAWAMSIADRVLKLINESAPPAS